MSLLKIGDLFLSQLLNRKTPILLIIFPTVLEEEKEKMAASNPKRTIVGESSI